jgi:CHAT domain-containing protein
VLETLASCNIAHFSCHGITDVSNPSNSHLLLVGLGGTEADSLNIKEISSTRNFDRAMLAYLSACHTANYTSKKTLLDEAIHIARGFQLAGFPHVIGTLWEANDSKAREVATEFYKNLFDSLGSGRGFGDGIVAEALHKAVAGLREEFEDNPILWAPFIHLGA